MTKYNEELANLDNVEILGFKGTVESVPKTLELVDNIKSGCCDVGIIQLMDADAIAGPEHLKQGIIHAMNAFDRKENLANDLGIEILLRTSAQRQISKAFKILGLKEGEMNMAVAMIDCPDYFVDELSDIFERDDSVLEADDLKLMKIYDIPEKELKTIHITNILIDKTSKLIIEQ